MNSIIVRNLSKIRIMNNLSKTAFAEKMGITRQTFNKIENGADLKWDNMAKLRLNLGVDLNALVLDEYIFKKPVDDVKQGSILHELFNDFIAYDLNPDLIRREIIAAILKKTMLNKPWLMKILKFQNNRLIIEFMQILTIISKQNHTKLTMRKKGKKILEETINKHKADSFDKYVKKHLLKQLNLLNDMDCYYLISHPQIALQILTNSINKIDREALKYFGCEIFLEDKKFIN
ncbi:helix-turn-helix transcriptional regulator [Sulfurimonas sp.]|uniref:helix-turn-helix transcriptional regulator n=1 Tax=Sulfurimonas sp. TaxID=2022749 RepID=UPI001A04AA63|nr:helix-turn-helix transcriptional regulator [Sulfurimonas sp.]MBE0515290.1 helix-turn-helix transcriptional regulator [Sulfurimonas sp.]